VRVSKRSIPFKNPHSDAEENEGSQGRVELGRGDSAGKGTKGSKALSYSKPSFDARLWGSEEEAMVADKTSKFLPACLFG